MTEAQSRSIRRGARIALPGFVALALSSIAGSALAQQQSAEVTFAKDVAPILQQNCQECHRAGSIGPMSLMNYEEVRPWAQVIKLRVEQQEMPPYHYDTAVGIQQLKDDKRLSAADIETISRWVESGAPEGNPADLPPQASFPDPSAFRLAEFFGEPDLIVPSRPFTVPATGQDMWWEPLVPIGNTTKRYIRAIEVKPSVEGRAVAHHANTTLYTYDENGVLQPGEGRFTEYALGKLGEIVPEGAGRELPPNSSIRWSIHYYPSGEVVENEVTELAFWLHPEGYVPEYEQTLAQYSLQSDIDILPHSTAMTQGFHSWDHPVRIDSFQPHGHLRLVGKSLEIFHPSTGKREMVSMISNWNPGWHLSHMYEEDVAPLVPTGSVMILTAWYDNTENNPFNPDPDQFVNYGSRTGDEMSHAWIAVSHLDEAGYQKIKAEREAKSSAVGATEE